MRSEVVPKLAASSSKLQTCVERAKDVSGDSILGTRNIKAI